MNHLTDREFELLRAMQRAAPSGGSLTFLGQTLGISSSQLTRMLRPLVDAGWAERRVVPTPEGREVHYSARSGVSVRWIEPSLDAAIAWTAPTVDWSFPLVSRIPDAGAHEPLLMLMRALRENRRIEPTPHGIAAVVFGSAARGDARRRSDIDVVMIADVDGESDESDELERSIVDIATQLGLGLTRPLDVRYRTMDDLGALYPDIIIQAVQNDGIVIYDALSASASERLWRSCGVRA